MNEPEAVGLPEDPADFDLLEWIDSGTVARRTVIVYNRPDLIDELERIEESLKAAGYSEQRDEAPKDGPLSDDRDDAVEPLIERRAQIEADLEAARSMWTVRALSGDEVDGTYVTVPAPKVPVQPGPGASEALRERWGEKVQRYAVAQARADADRKLAQVALAVESIESPKGTAAGVTVEALKALRARPHGGRIIDLLHRAVTEASKSDVEIPRPTSPGSSTGTRA